MVFTFTVAPRNRPRCIFVWPRCIFVSHRTRATGRAAAGPLRNATRNALLDGVPRTSYCTHALGVTRRRRPSSSTPPTSALVAAQWSAPVRS